MYITDETFVQGQLYLTKTNPGTYDVGLCIGVDNEERSLLAFKNPLAANACLVSTHF